MNQTTKDTTKQDMSPEELVRAIAERMPVPPTTQQICRDLGVDYNSAIEMAKSIKLPAMDELDDAEFLGWVRRLLPIYGNMRQLSLGVDWPYLNAYKRVKQLRWEAYGPMLCKMPDVNPE